MQARFSALFAALFIIFTFSSLGCAARLSQQDEARLAYLERQQGQDINLLMQMAHRDDAQMNRLEMEIDRLEMEVSRLKCWLETGRDPLDGSGPSVPNQQTAPTDGRK